MYGAENFVGTMILCVPRIIDKIYEYAQHRPVDTKLNPFSALGLAKSSLTLGISRCSRALNYNFASFYPLRQSLGLTSQIIVMVFFSKFTISLFALQFFAVQGFPAESRSDGINICGGNAYPCPVGYICCGPLVDINGTVYGSSCVPENGACPL
ncbi:hypothetical protein LENED_012790 [Lentinula edodes]|uniref:Uncharacterized protein n=1 Tax=Lentinula edodes TaxID=5353 RepID=A0A1Q3ETI0_LENED|nr:hypothetical protein LENED_012790 [Lentinula edodes]